MRAGELLEIYRRRQAGYEEGRLRYELILYRAVCTLVEVLAQLPRDEEIRIDDETGEAIFVVARSGVALATLPVDVVQDGRS